MTNPVDSHAVTERVEELQQRLRALSPAREVGIVAVTKGFGIDAPRAALAAGLTMLGENYAQELLAKN
ncbi:MAG: YggS family pyridoxal phosphate-dependent enzyme, partial [Actinomycetes bacterium]